MIIIGTIVSAAFIASLLFVVLRSIATRDMDKINIRRSRQRTYIKGAGVVITEPKSDTRIVGDDSRPYSARIRDMHKPVGV